MRTNLFFTILLSACTIPALSQTYSLDDCKRMALEHNRQIQSSRIETEIALQTRREAFTNYFPSISAAGTIFNANHNTIQADMAIPIPVMGMEMPFSLAMLKHGKAAGITAVQPIFAGGQIFNGNKLSAIGEEVSRFQLKLSEDEILETTEQYFWQLIALQEKLNTIATIEKQLDNIRNDVEIAVKAGISTHNDLLRVELQQQEVQSNRLKIENGMRINKLLLKQYTGIQDNNFDIFYNGFQEPESPALYFISPEEAVIRRTEYQLLNKNVEATKLQKRMTLGKNLPSVGVGAGYLYHDFTGRDNDFGMVFATVSVPISSWWGGSHAVKRDKLKLQQAENDRLQSIEMMQIEVQQCWHELQEAYEQILLSQKSIASATENLRLNENYFHAGTVSLSDLLDAQTLFQQSKDQYTDACSEYRTRLSRYFRITGRQNIGQ